jgi:hypothetical protein
MGCDVFMSYTVVKDLYSAVTGRPDEGRREDIPNSEHEMSSRLGRENRDLPR